MQNRLPVIEPRHLEGFLDEQAATVLLVLSAEPAMLNLTRLLHKVPGGVAQAVVVCDESNAHLVPVSRVPCVRYYVGSKLQISERLDLRDANTDLPKSIVRAITTTRAE